MRNTGHRFDYFIMNIMYVLSIVMSQISTLNNVEFYNSQNWKRQSTNPQSYFIRERIWNVLSSDVYRFGGRIKTKRKSKHFLPLFASLLWTHSHSPPFHNSRFETSLPWFQLGLQIYKITKEFRNLLHHVHFLHYW